MKYKLLCILSLICFWKISTAQKENNIWYFGNQAGLDFSSGAPIALTNGALFTYDNSSTVSDSSGNLLFYTNSVTVWNKNHAIMANGTGLMGNNSAGQSALIVRQPNTQIYYIFTTDAFDWPNGFRYSTVDMTLNGGLGGVVQKNILLFTPSTEKIDGIYNCSDNSFWILSHEWNSNQFKAFNLSSTGLNTTPVTSNVGSIHAGGSPTGYNSLGQMTLSKDGSKLVCGIHTLGNIEVFDFNITTGIVSNPIIITGYPEVFGVALSPDAKLLYYTIWYDDAITQLDITLGTAAAIAASASVVGTVTGPGTYGYYVGYLQLGPDNKLYAAVYDDTYLSVINNPDALGVSCNFVDNGVSLGGKTSLAGLSRVVAVNNISNYSISSQNYCLGYPTNFSLSDTSQITSCIWSFGDSVSGLLNSSTQINPTHVFTSQGNYSVRAIVTGNCDIDTISQTITIYPSPTVSIAGNMPVCNGDTLFLYASGATGNLVYQWNNGDAGSATTTTFPGTYVVTVTNPGNCSAVDSVIVSFFPTTSTPLSASICPGESIFIQGNYQTTSGIYFDTLSSVNSCDSILATTLTVNPTFNTTTAKTICSSDSIFLQGAFQTSPGIYYDTLVSGSGCDSVIVTSLEVSSFFYDSLAIAICSGDSFFVQGAYQTVPGFYNDTLDVSGSCDSINTTLLTLFPSYSIPVNISIFNGDSAFLQNEYQHESGIYFDILADKNGCDSVIVTTLLIVPKVETDCGSLSIPNIFSPNGDRNNDILYVHGTCIKSLSLIIYDRWGEKVFETSDKNTGWDGNHHGKPLRSAVFAYYIKATFTNDEEKTEKGNITLIR